MVGLPLGLPWPQIEATLIAGCAGLDPADQASRRSTTTAVDVKTATAERPDRDPAPGLVPFGRGHPGQVAPMNATNPQVNDGELSGPRPPAVDLTALPVGKGGVRPPLRRLSGVRAAARRGVASIGSPTALPTVAGMIG